MSNCQRGQATSDGQTRVKVEVMHSSRLARKAMGKPKGLPRDVTLAQRAKGMLTRNLWSEVELANDIRGRGCWLSSAQDKGLWPYRSTIGTVHWASVVLMRLQVRRVRAHRSGRDNSSTTLDDNNQKLRQQLPLALCWVITRWTRRLSTFVCLSRTKQLVVKPAPFARISKLGGKPTSRLKFVEMSSSNLPVLDTWLTTGNRGRGFGAVSWCAVYRYTSYIPRSERREGRQVGRVYEPKQQRTNAHNINANKVTIIT